MKTKTQSTKEIKKQIESNTFQWYALSVISGQEDIVIQNLKERIKKQGLQEDVIDFFAPTVSEASFKKGEKVIRVKKLYPGYIFVRSKMNDKIRYVIRNTPGVRLIVGAETHPVPLSEEEYKRIVDHVQQSQQRASLHVPFREGDVVVLKTGDFQGMQGKIHSIDIEKSIAVVHIELLGRLTPVAVRLNKIELV